MKLVLAVVLGTLGLFAFIGQANKIDLSRDGLHNTVIERAKSRYWDSDLEDVLAMLTYEERTLVYEFMKEYHSVYVDYYQGEITIGDAIFYQKLTGKLPVQQSKELALNDIIRKQLEEIESLKAQSKHYQIAYENALNAQAPSQPQVIFIPTNTDQKNSTVMGRDETPPTAKKHDKTSVYRSYGVYELEEQLRRARLLDRQDPKWSEYQTDSPRTQEVRLMLLEAREAADRSMR
ncbi:hypothetical protein [Marinobacter nauticus]|uniref:Uncharacterized protein n=1 Tax=Marinobacter nauticus TaxID=2743 RepID=A0A1M2UX64_MARNT|nr:hypothetical protein [Marinobacter nauticus]OJS99953.1 hypothetical protein BEE62_07515 [Marinobacter nauticus]